MFEIDLSQILAQRRQEEAEKKLAKQQFYEGIGQLLKKHRELKGWSQSVVARKCGFISNEIYLYERARIYPSLHKFIRLCKVLDIDFRILGTTCLTKEESLWLAAFRNHDYKAVLDWLREEL